MYPLPPKPQRGVSLVEVMVSLAIGLIVILVVTQIFINTGRNHLFRQGQSENFNNAQNAISSFTTQLSKAGYRRNPAQAMNLAFPADANAHANGCKFLAGEAAYAMDTKTLCIRYQPRDAAELDCAGQPTTSPSTLTTYVSATATQLFVEKYSISGNTLMCTSSRHNKAIPMADGIGDILFEFGTGPIVASEAERRITAYQTAAPQETQAIRAMRYTILLANTTGKVTQNMSSTICERWKKAGGDEAQCTASDGRLYELISGAIMMRNLMP